MKISVDGNDLRHLDISLFAEFRTESCKLPLSRWFIPMDKIKTLGAFCHGSFGSARCVFMKRPPGRDISAISRGGMGEWVILPILESPMIITLWFDWGIDHSSFCCLERVVAFIGKSSSVSKSRIVAVEVRGVSPGVRLDWDERNIGAKAGWVVIGSFGGVVFIVFSEVGRLGVFGECSDMVMGPWVGVIGALAVVVSSTIIGLEGGFLFPVDTAMGEAGEGLSVGVCRGSGSGVFCVFTCREGVSVPCEGIVGGGTCCLYLAGVVIGRDRMSGIALWPRALILSRELTLP